MSEGFSVQLGRDNPFVKIPQLTKKSYVESGWINPYSGEAEDLVCISTDQVTPPDACPERSTDRPGNRHKETLVSKELNVLPLNGTSMIICRNRSYALSVS